MTFQLCSNYIHVLGSQNNPSSFVHSPLGYCPSRLSPVILAAPFDPLLLIPLFSNATLLSVEASDFFHMSSVLAELSSFTLLGGCQQRMLNELSGDQQPTSCLAPSSQRGHLWRQPVSLMASRVWKIWAWTFAQPKASCPWNISSYPLF